MISMKKILFLALIFTFCSSSAMAVEEKEYFWSDWKLLSYFKGSDEGSSTSSPTSKKFGRWPEEHKHYGQMTNFQPYLEDSRHVQVPQWEHEDWYLEDWFTQEKGMDMVKGFYKADIFRDQFQPKNRRGQNEGIKRLVVGPSFYRLSGFDKRRVVAVLDATYGVTQRDKNAAVILEDWHTKRDIGYYTKDGLRLH